MIAEIAEDLTTIPDAIFCSVGGGGLIGGVLSGCENAGWENGRISESDVLRLLILSIVPVVALETHGSACFSHALSINQGGWINELPEELASVTQDEEFKVKIAHIKELKSKASSLGASVASAGVVRKAINHPGGVICGTIPDELAMDICSHFAGDS